MNTKKILLTILLAVLLPASGLVPVHADDTDIYLKPPSISRDDAPNILIILDNSGSMETNNVTITSPYDPTTVYTGSFNNSDVYWSTSGTAPSSSTTNYFSASNNSCAASQTNLGSNTGATGIYADTVVMWHGSSSPANWGSMLSSTDAEVACKADSPSYGGSGPIDITNPPTLLSNEYADSVNNKQWTTNSNQEISWASYPTITLFSGNYLNYLTSTTTTVTMTRIEAARDAVTQLIDSNIDVRVGMMTFNYNSSFSPSGPPGGRVIARIQDLTSSWRTSLTSIISQIRGYIEPGSTFGSGSYETWTPLAETEYEAYRYLSGQSVDYGGINWYSQGAKTILSGAGVTNQPAPYPDICAENTGASTPCAPYDNSSVTVSNILTDYSNLGSSNYGTYISPFKYDCQQAYIIIVTDGSPENDTDANTAIDALTNGTTYPTPSIGGNTGNTSDRLDDLAGYMYNNDIDSNLTGTQRVLTYTIGFGSDVASGSAGQQLLEATADAGHGKYFDASNASNLAPSLQNAIVDIQTQASSFAAPSLSVNAFNKLYNGDSIYFALFQPSSTVAWDGNIKKLHLCNTSDESTYGCTYGEIIDANGAAAIDPATMRIKNSSQSYWSATADGPTVDAGGAGGALETQLPSAARNLYTYTGDYSTATGGGLATEQTGFQITNDFTSTSGTLYSAAIANYNLLDNSGAISAMSSTTAQDTAVQGTINWMLGYDYGSASTQRWPFGDPLHSRPYAVTYGDVGGDTSKPITKLFVATNDGVIHMIDDSTGQEQWAFVPKEELGNQYTLAQDADGIHPYGADATPTFWINDVNGDGIIEPSQGDFVYMYIGMRRGGRNIYCFDVTPPSTLTSYSTTFTPKLKWVIQGGTSTGFSRLGYTWSAPQVATIRTACTGTGCTAGDSVPTTVLIFGGGYNPSQDIGNFSNTPSTDPYGTDDGADPSGMGNSIYIVDPTTGGLIWSAGSDSTSTLVMPNMIYSIPSDLSLEDSNGDGAVDRLYFGDMGGQVWRFDLSSQLTTGTSGGTTGYVFADLNCTWTGSAGSYTRDCGTNSTLTITDQDWEKIFYPPDIAQVSDATYSTTSTYDVIAVATGDRADPLDYQTGYAGEGPVHNRIYALRDYNTGGAPTTAPQPIDRSKLVDLTSDPLQTTGTTGYSTALSSLQSSDGWYIDLEYPSTAAISLTLPNTASTVLTNQTWVGEKALAKPVIFDNVIYVTTYTPANVSNEVVTCSANEGVGTLYALGLLNAASVVDLNGDGSVDRSTEVGGGIPSELVTVIRSGGVTALVGTSGGAASPNLNATLPRGESYWYQQ